MRGNPPETTEWTPGGRSIPACAGEPARSILGSRDCPVYPRVCGGTHPGSHRVHYMLGLSPRVRGNPAAPPQGRHPQRSIPACAGEPFPGTRPVHARKVYPRVCGGTPHPRPQSPGTLGLSPRVRGNLVYRNARHVRTRSIPACAGEPWATTATRWTAAVYPRVCGGTPSPRITARPREGLSPRVRGNHVGGSQDVAPLGSIPACAGEPGNARAGCSPAGVYPRVCGGTQQQIPGHIQHPGLSPRVRGNLRLPPLLLHRRGSIPACAGEPVLGGGPTVAT